MWLASLRSNDMILLSSDVFNKAGFGGELVPVFGHFFQVLQCIS